MTAIKLEAHFTLSSLISSNLKQLPESYSENCRKTDPQKNPKFTADKVSTTQPLLLLKIAAEAKDAPAK